MGRGLATGFAAAMVVACSSTTTQTVQAPPTAGTYTITFPSAAAAVATNTVQVIVFDGTANNCSNLIQKQSSGQQLPAALYTGQVTELCDLFKAEQQGVSPDAGAGAGQIPIGYGHYAVLAIAQRGGSDFMRGCAIGDLSASSSTISINVAPANLSKNPVPALPSSCAPNQPLTQHCGSNAAQCSP